MAWMDDVGLSIIVTGQQLRLTVGTVYVSSDRVRYFGRP